MPDDYVSVLEHEFNAHKGSFLLGIRVYLTWDKAAFNRLTQAMLACCRAYDARDRRAAGIGSGADTMCLPRWLADGFWYVGTFVRDWTTHPAWHDTTRLEQDYYNDAYGRLHWLAEWFFTGDCPVTDPDRVFAPM